MRDPDTRPARSPRAGAIATALAFVMWGALPIYWKALRPIPPSQILAHRIVWTSIFAGVVLTAVGRWREVAAALRSARGIAFFLAAAFFLGANWFTFIYAVNTDRVVECSFGYFINPLVNVIFGFFFLRERFRRLEAVAIGLAACGVLELAIFGYGGLPWIALLLAFTFATYSLIRKTAGYESLPGLFLETAALLPIAATYLAYLGSPAWEAVRREGVEKPWLLASTGIVTAIPLLLFAFGARRIRLATVGFLQYVTPTGMFALGVFVYGEPFYVARGIAFALIWAGLALYTFDRVAAMRAGPRPDR